MTRLSYNKTFLSGMLKGITVRANFHVPDADVVSNIATLEAMTAENPGTDAASKALFVVSDVRSIPVVETPARPVRRYAEIGNGLFCRVGDGKRRKGGR